MRVRIELDADCPAALAALAGLAGLDDLGGGPTAGRAGMAIEYATREPRRVNPTVVARLVDVGARVVSVIAAAPPLEEVYAEVVGGSTAGETPPATIGGHGR